MALRALPSIPEKSTILHLPDIRETDASTALVLYGFEDVQECDGARTLQLVERAVDSMRALRARADYISAQSLDLIHLTQRERLQMQAELRRAREEAASFQRQAEDAMAAFAKANLRLREAELSRREAELATQRAHARAEAAETRTRSLELYLKKISRYLSERLTPDFIG
ncbi:hypothetical protein FV218_12200 [Methylobacterium sp. WL69]|uniref:hypothetical protein n=1 Tax=Methylobacterium sp. WL69 TaxID=2603893 RepID=UPI0011C9A634|nr:hypothetical protein [Methylobacterium sp. WL69]TXM73019.1 hypothetical protein FV218_12200 [Methylobacterium sp. WL69]